MRRALLPPLLAVATAAFVPAAVVVTAGWPTATVCAMSASDKPSGLSGDKTNEDAPPHSNAQPSSDALKKEFAEVIEGQLAAFRAGEFAKAYTYAASSIKNLFPASDFEEMVKSAYPVIANSSTAEFGLAFDVGDEAVINVRVENSEKKSVLYQYMLQKEDGKWKISGVSEVKSSGLSV